MFQEEVRKLFGTKVAYNSEVRTLPCALFQQVLWLSNYLTREILLLCPE
jgi:hypothetical protein